MRDRLASWERIAPLPEEIASSRTLAKSYLQRIACVIVPKPDPVGIGGVNALEDVGMNAGAILLERFDEIGGVYEHLWPFNL